MKGFPDLPPIWLVGFLILNWGLARAVPGNPGSAFLVLLSTSLVGLAFVLIFWSAWRFYHHKTTIEPHHKPKTLIVDGPFRVSRNPIYLAMALILLGAIIANGQPLGLILLPFFIGIITKRFIEPEEAMLRDAFGDQADHYLAATRRWI